MTDVNGYIKSLSEKSKNLSAAITGITAINQSIAKKRLEEAKALAAAISHELLMLEIELSR